MARYVNSVLMGDERIEYQTELHWIIYIKGLFLTALGGVLSVYLRDLMHMFLGGIPSQAFEQMLAWGTAAIVGLGCLFLLHAYIKQTSTELVVTNRRVIAKFGVISRATYEIMLSRVEGANVEQSVLGRILGFGSIVVHGTGGGISPIDLVSNPRAFQSYLVHEINKNHTMYAHGGHD